MSIVEKPAARMPKSVTSQTMSELDELIKPFGWTTVRSPQFTEEQRALLHKSLTVSSFGKPLPDVFWRAIEIPDRVVAFDQFTTLNDAKALARALCDSMNHVRTWLAMAIDGASDELLRDLLSDLPMVTDTHSGNVFCESHDETHVVSLWFGRKAGKACPDLAGADLIKAVRQLFQIEPATSAEPELEPPATGTRSDVKAPAIKRRIDAAHHTPAAGETVAAKQPSKAAKKAAAAARPIAASDSTALMMVSLDDIQPATSNHRKGFDVAELSELAESIKQHGVLQPILLRQISISPDGKHRLYEIIAGERRWRAAMQAGLAEIPAQITERAGLQASLAMFEENIRRVDLSPIERAQAIQSLMAEHQLSQKEVGKIIGVQQGQVSNELRLLSLPKELQQHVASGKLAPTLIRAVLPYCDLPKVMQQITKTIDDRIKGDESIEAHDLENWIRTAIISQSRPLKYDSGWQSYSAPDPKKRHFAKCSEEDMKSLNVRTFDCVSLWDGQERTFEVQKFDELNRKPLAARREKHKEYKSSRPSHNASTGHESNAAMFKNAWAFRGRVQEDLIRALSIALKSSKDRGAVNRICLAMMMIDESAVVFHSFCGARIYDDDAMEAVLKTLDCPAKQRDDLFRDAVIAACETGELEVSLNSVRAASKVLGIELSTLWEPAEAFFELLTDSGRSTCAAMVDLPSNATSSQLFAAWPRGLVPEFVRPFLGLPEIKPAKATKPKAKKGSAA